MTSLELVECDVRGANSTRQVRKCDSVAVDSNNRIADFLAEIANGNQTNACQLKIDAIVRACSGVITVACRLLSSLKC